MKKINLNKEIVDKIFKTYDIRGVYPEEINKDIVFYIGKAFAIFLKRKLSKKRIKVVISCDFRLSSPELKKAFIGGLLEENLNIIDAGFTTTPMNYFLINFLKVDGGAMITASHNPKEYNGIKLSLKKAIPIGESNGLKEIKKILLKNLKFENQKQKIYRKVSKKNFINEYVNFLLKHSQMSNIKSQMSVVIDCGNGAVGYILSKLLKKLKVKYYPLYFKPDGNFPNRDPNPLNKNALTKLKEILLKKKADLGIAFDGDGDRVFFLDKKANFIGPNFVYALLIQDIFKIKKRPKIIIDIRSSKSIKELVKKKGGIFKFSKVGHYFFKKVMRQEKADLGGELSGHYYFKDFFFCDSGIFAMLKILKIFLKSDKKISSLIKSFKKYHQSGEINFKVKNKKKTIQRVKDYFKNLSNKSSRKIKIFNFDGLNVETDNFWFNLRLSNTEPLIRLNLEAKTKKILEKKLKLLSKLIRT